MIEELCRWIEVTTLWAMIMGLLSVALSMGAIVWVLFNHFRYRRFKKEIQRALESLCIEVRK